jgi:hypothetical protein
VDNAAILSLAGLRGLTAIGGSLHIAGNLALTDIEALAGLDSLLGAEDGALVIGNNPLLSTAAAEAFARRLTDNGFDGSVIVDRNAP